MASHFTPSSTKNHQQTLIQVSKQLKIKATANAKINHVHVAVKGNEEVKHGRGGVIVKHQNSSSEEASSLPHSQDAIVNRINPSQVHLNNKNHEPQGKYQTLDGALVNMKGKPVA